MILITPDPTPLQQVRALNRSSPQFFDQLATILDEEEFDAHIPDLHNDDAAWLVEYLSTVRTSQVHWYRFLTQPRS